MVATGRRYVRLTTHKPSLTTVTSLEVKEQDYSPYFIINEKNILLTKDTGVRDEGLYRAFLEALKFKHLASP